MAYGNAVQCLHWDAAPRCDGRRGADKDFGYVHACAAYPLSDMTIKIPIE